MRVLLDECVPRRLARDLPAHDVSTVGSLRLAGTPDGRLLQQASQRFDVLITVDQSLEYQQAPDHRIALVTIISRSNAYEMLRPITHKILAVLETIGPGDRIRIDSPD